MIKITLEGFTGTGASKYDGRSQEYFKKIRNNKKNMLALTRRIHVLKTNLNTVV